MSTLNLNPIINNNIPSPIQSENEGETLFDSLKSLFPPPLPWKIVFFSDPSLASGGKLFKLPMGSKYIDRLEFNIRKFQSNYFLMCAVVNMIGMIYRPILFLIVPFMLFLWYQIFMRRKIDHYIKFSIFGLFSFQLPVILLLIVMGIFSGYVMYENDNYLFRYSLSFIGIFICFIHASFRVTGQEGEYDILVQGNRTFADLKSTVKEIANSAITDVKSIYQRKPRNTPEELQM